MPIDKPEAGSSFLNKVGFGFTILDSEALQRINDAVAIGVWAHLCSKPQAWKICEKEVCNSLGLGRDRYRRAMSLLREIGLVWHDYTRVKGKIVSKQISVTWTLAHAKGNHIDHMPDIQANGTNGHHMPEIPSDGKNLQSVSQAVLVKKERSVKKETTEKDMSSGDDSPAIKVSRKRTPEQIMGYTFDAVQAAYNEHMGNDPACVMNRVMDDKTKRNISNSHKKGLVDCVDDWATVFQVLMTNDWVNGNSDRRGSWKATIEYATRPDQVTKVHNEMADREKL